MVSEWDSNRRCPAFGTICSKCEKRNHFSTVCRSNAADRPTSASGQRLKKQWQQRSGSKSQHKIHEVEDDYDSEESIYNINEDQNSHRRQYFTKLEVKLNKQAKSTPIRFQLDSGATCSTMTMLDYQRLTDKKPPQTEARLKLYDGSIIKPVGADTLYCRKELTMKKVHFNNISGGPTSHSPHIDVAQVNPALSL